MSAPHHQQLYLHSVSLASSHPSVSTFLPHHFPSVPLRLTQPCPGSLTSYPLATDKFSRQPFLCTPSQGLLEPWLLSAARSTRSSATLTYVVAALLQSKNGESFRIHSSADIHLQKRRQADEWEWELIFVFTQHLPQSTSLSSFSNSQQTQWVSRFHVTLSLWLLASRCSYYSFCNPVFLQMW